MKKVNIYKLNSEANQDIVLTCTLKEGNEIEFTGDERLQHVLQSRGIKNAANGETIFPSDGLIFLENLKKNYKGPYLIASEVIS